MGRRSCTGCLGVLAASATITGVVLIAAAVTLKLVFPMILQQQVEEVRSCMREGGTYVKLNGGITNSKPEQLTRNQITKNNF